MTILQPATFIAENTKTETLPSGSNFTTEIGTVEASFAGETRRVFALRFGDGSIVCYGAFVGRYRTSPQPWPAKITARQNGIELVDFGRDDRSPRFEKRRGLSWAA